MATKRHGGARPGAGRPPIPESERSKNHMVSLYPDEWEKARKIGDGSISGGIRAALKAYKVKKS